MRQTSEGIAFVCRWRHVCCCMHTHLFILLALPWSDDLA